MRKLFKTILTLTLLAVLSPLSAMACTSMLISAKASGTGRPMMWKHRDTSAEDNFVDRVEATSGRLGYVALYNGGDSLRRQAWMGMNDAGFAVMNTHSYNLQPDTARLKDMDGYLMSMALQSCRSVDDFEKMLINLRKPHGVTANFGVMDARGGLAYFEVNDHAYKRFNVSDTQDGIMIRTNYSMAGAKSQGYGYVRYMNVKEILKDEIAEQRILPQDLTEKASRSFYNSVLKHDYATDTCTWVVDQDFIPRYTSTASIVIEGVNPGEPVNQMIMWTMLGYPPCSVMLPVTLAAVPADLRPTDPGYTSPMCNRTNAIKRKVFPITIDNGNKYINMQLLRPVMEKARAASLEMYSRTRPKQ